MSNSVFLLHRIPSETNDAFLLNYLLYPPSASFDFQMLNKTLTTTTIVSSYKKISIDFAVKASVYNISHMMKYATFNGFVIKGTVIAQNRVVLKFFEKLHIFLPLKKQVIFLFIVL